MEIESRLNIIETKLRYWKFATTILFLIVVVTHLTDMSPIDMVVAETEDGVDFSTLKVNRLEVIDKGVVMARLGVNQQEVSLTIGPDGSSEMAGLVFTPKIGARIIAQGKESISEMNSRDFAVTIRDPERDARIQELIERHLKQGFLIREEDKELDRLLVFGRCAFIGKDPNRRGGRLGISNSRNQSAVIAQTMDDDNGIVLVYGPDYEKRKEANVLSPVAPVGNRNGIP